MKAKNTDDSDDLRPEYDFDYSKAVIGKHYRELIREGASIVALEPDVAKAFPDSESVNEALRSLLNFTRATQRLTRRSSARAKARQ